METTVAIDGRRTPKRLAELFGRILGKLLTMSTYTLGDIFDYIEMFYNPKRRHGFNNKLSPVNYENQYFKRLASVW